MITLEHLNNTIFNDRVDWQSINQELALRNTKCLDLLHEACLIEAYLPVYTGKMNELFWDDLDATSIFTIEAYEAYGHYFIIRKYLDIVGYNPVTDEEVLQVRSRDKDNVYTDKIRELVNFMGTEHFAAEFFKDLMKLTEEPVLKKMLKGFYAEEICHSQLVLTLSQLVLYISSMFMVVVIIHVCGADNDLAAVPVGSNRYSDAHVLSMYSLQLKI